MKKNKNFIRFISGFVLFFIWIVCIARFFGMQNTGPLSWAEIIQDWPWFVLPSLIVQFTIEKGGGFLWFCVRISGWVGGGLYKRAKLRSFGELSKFMSESYYS